MCLYDECPRGACGHPLVKHCPIRGRCDQEGCPCGQSRVMDYRARCALAGSDWTMSSAERKRRGLEEQHAV